MDTDLRGLDRKHIIPENRARQRVVPLRKGDAPCSIVPSSALEIRVNLRSSAVGPFLAILCGYSVFQ